jgi:hypothetical protein
MSQQVVMGAMLQCSFGAAPSSLSITPDNAVNANKMPAATIMDNVPMKNIMPFGMCNSPANPATKQPPPVLFAPAPCTPVTTAPWIFAGMPAVNIKNKPALNNNCKLMCNWAGVIQITNAGQATVNIP